MIAEILNALDEYDINIVTGVPDGWLVPLIKAISEAMTGHKHDDGIIVVADDLSTAATVLDTGITTCGAITVAAALS